MSMFHSLVEWLLPLVRCFSSFDLHSSCIVLLLLCLASVGGTVVEMLGLVDVECLPKSSKSAKAKSAFTCFHRFWLRSLRNVLLNISLSHGLRLVRIFLFLGFLSGSLLLWIFACGSIERHTSNPSLEL